MALSEHDIAVATLVVEESARLTWRRRQGYQSMGCGVSERAALATEENRSTRVAAASKSQ